MNGIFGMNEEQYRQYLEAAQAINIRYAKAQEQQKIDRTSPYDSLGPTELVGLYRELGWWDTDPEVPEDVFWERVKTWACQPEVQSADEAAQLQSASPSSPSAQSSVPPAGVDPDWALEHQQ